MLLLAYLVFDLSTIFCDKLAAESPWVNLAIKEMNKAIDVINAMGRILILCK